MLQELQTKLSDARSCVDAFGLLAMQAESLLILRVLRDRDVTAGHVWIKDGTVAIAASARGGKSTGYLALLELLAISEPRFDLVGSGGEHGETISFEIERIVSDEIEAVEAIKRILWPIDELSQEKISPKGEASINTSGRKLAAESAAPPKTVPSDTSSPAAPTAASAGAQAEPAFTGMDTVIFDGFVDESQVSGAEFVPAAVSEGQAEPATILAGQNEIAQPSPVTREQPIEEFPLLAEQFPMSAEELSTLAGEPIPGEELFTLTVEPIPAEELLTLIGEPMPAEEFSALTGEPMPADEFSGAILPLQSQAEEASSGALDLAVSVAESPPADEEFPLSIEQFPPSLQQFDQSVEPLNFSPDQVGTPAEAKSLPLDVQPLDSAEVVSKGVEFNKQEIPEADKNRTPVSPDLSSDTAASQPEYRDAKSKAKTLSAALVAAVVAVLLAPTVYIIVSRIDADRRSELEGSDFIADQVKRLLVRDSSSSISAASESSKWAKYESEQHMRTAESGKIQLPSP